MHFKLVFYLLVFSHFALPLKVRITDYKQLLLWTEVILFRIINVDVEGVKGAAKIPVMKENAIPNER